MKIHETSKHIAAAAVASAAVCALSLCLLIGTDSNYANAEISVSAEVFSANDESPKHLYSSEAMTFGDSLWGRFAKALEDGIDAWQD